MQSIKFLIQKFLIANFDPEAEKFIFKPSESSPHSSVEHLEVLSNVITIYHGTKSGDSNALQALFNHGLFQCDSTGRKTSAPFQFGHHHNPWHSAWHRNRATFEDTHHHIFKPDFVSLTPNDLRCILQQLHQYQKENQLCETDDNACVLPEDDIAKLLGRYQKHHQEILKITSNSLYAQLEQAYLQSVQAFLNAFAVTFVQHMVKPLLLDRGMDHKKVQAIGDVLTASINFVSNGSIVQSLAAVAAARVSETLFIRAGLTSTSARTIVGIINSVLAVISTPLNIADWLASSLGALAGIGLAYGNASMGKELAHHVIQTHFPKHRPEPSAVPVNPDEDLAEVVSPPSGAGATGLHQRG